MAGPPGFGGQAVQRGAPAQRRRHRARCRTVWRTLLRGRTGLEYFKDPEKTASVSNDRGWRSLGDMGYLDDDGYVYLTDRSTFTIVSGGVNIYPQEAENLLVCTPSWSTPPYSVFPTTNSARRSRRSCNPPTTWSRDPTSRPNSSSTAAPPGRLQMPRTIDFDPELPRDPNGKLYKRRIRERYCRGRTSRIV